MAMTHYNIYPQLQKLQMTSIKQKGSTNSLEVKYGQHLELKKLKEHVGLRKH